ncbi:MAG TPA: DMT family transporter [Anaerolineaceae bacterium]|nr:DMT family transporter [Anaerolineaceae bacterium]
MIKPFPKTSTTRSVHLRAVLQALFVTFLWSTSWVLVKIGLEDIPALTFAGLRYTLAFLVLLPFALRAGLAAALRRLTRRDWLLLVVLGLFYYSITQGTQFLSLAYLPAVTLSLLLTFTTPVVAIAGVRLLGERPTPAQWFGVLLYLAGVLLYFYPVQLPQGQLIGIGIGLIGVLSNAFSSIMGRSVNRGGQLDPLTVTVTTMGIGGLILLAAGLTTQGLPPLSPLHWGIILWLAAVNSALAFTLWNLTLRTLSAMESSIINSTMLFQIAILAWVFLAERLNWQQAAGMIVAVAGTLIVQLKRAGAEQNESATTGEG